MCHEVGGRGGLGVGGLVLESVAPLFHLWCEECRQSGACHELCGGGLNLGFRHLARPPESLKVGEDTL